MKSTPQQLQSRGFAASELNETFTDKTFDELIECLKSTVPYERTLSARFLAQTKNSRAVSHLCEALHKEKKLYTKIEISNALVSFEALAIPSLIDSLGKIGKNQHRMIVKDEFKKSSYPLPRDIASRTLIRIGKGALACISPYLNVRHHGTN